MKQAATSGLRAACPPTRHAGRPRSSKRVQVTGAAAGVLVCWYELGTGGVSPVGRAGHGTQPPPVWSQAAARGHSVGPRSPVGALCVSLHIQVRGRGARHHPPAPGREAGSFCPRPKTLSFCHLPVAGAPVVGETDGVRIRACVHALPRPARQELTWMRGTS